MLASNHFGESGWCGQIDVCLGILWRGRIEEEQMLLRTHGHGQWKSHRGGGGFKRQDKTRLQKTKQGKTTIRRQDKKKMVRVERQDKTR